MTNRAAAERIAADHVEAHLYDACEVVESYPLVARGCWAVLVRVRDNVGLLEFGVVVDGSGTVQQEDVGRWSFFETKCKCRDRAR